MREPESRGVVCAPAVSGEERTSELHGEVVTVPNPFSGGCGGGDHVRDGSAHHAGDDGAGSGLPVMSGRGLGRVGILVAERRAEGAVTVQVDQPGKDSAHPGRKLPFEVLTGSDLDDAVAFDHHDTVEYLQDGCEDVSSHHHPR